jgi:Spy/CpxP family protein refolding chaperone
MFSRAASYLLLTIVVGTFASPASARQQVLATKTLGYPQIAQNKDNDKLYEKLNLTPDQIRRVKALHKQSTPEIKQKLAALNKAKQELLALQTSNGALPAIKAKENQITILKRSLADAKLKYSKSMQEILTAEQWTKLQKIRQERRAQRGSES